MVAIIEKQRLIIISGKDTEEPVPLNGRICQFKDLIVKTVLIDEVFKDPGRVNQSFFIDIETKVHNHFLESFSDVAFNTYQCHYQPI